jgi:hypothetical protein
VLLGVVEASERPAVAERQALEVEEDGGGYERPGERAAPGLVSAGDEPTAEAPIKGEEAPTGSRGTSPRAFRSFPGASR